ncbi:Major facilitator superfamily domain-containing protein 6-A [Armadillidium vulgare]|nr:Major facilitator superfamily domain-containing protein 6-A [Armadillidium vulgare]
MKVLITRLNATFENETFDSDRLLCPTLGRVYNAGDNCVSKCRAKAIREQVCMNKKSVEELNPSLTFYSHLAIRLFKEFTLATSMPLLEGAAVTIIKQHGGDFGFQRMFCNVGMMVMTPISGTLIDHFSKVNGIEDFRPAMYMYCALKVIAAVIILFLNMNFKKKSNKVMSDFSSNDAQSRDYLFPSGNIFSGNMFWLHRNLLILATSRSWSRQENDGHHCYNWLHIRHSIIDGVHIYHKKIGACQHYNYGLLCLCCSSIWYTLISSPWWAMPFEALECVTVSLMVVSFMSYASVLSTPATVVTLQGMYGGLYNGVGRGAGSLIGGFLIEKLGIFKTFRIIAAIGGCSGLVYFVLNFLFFRKNRHIRKEAAIEAKKSRKINEVVDKPQPTVFDESSEVTKIESLKNNQNVADDKIEVKIFFKNKSSFCRRQ